MSLFRVAFARLLAAIPMMVLVSLIIFSIPYFIPGDPAFTIAGPNATIDDIERIRSELGLDRPIVGQYLAWLVNAATLDFGESYILGREVRTMIGERMDAVTSPA